MIIKPEAQNENQLAHTKGNFMCCEENPFNEKPRKIIMYVQIASDKTEKFFHINLFMLSYKVPLGIIYGGKIVETGRLDLKTTQKCNAIFVFF